MKYISCNNNEGVLFADFGLWLHQLTDEEPVLVDPGVQSGVHHQGLQSKNRSGYRWVALILSWILHPAWRKTFFLSSADIQLVLFAVASAGFVSKFNSHPLLFSSVSFISVEFSVVFITIKLIHNE